MYSTNIYNKRQTYYNITVISSRRDDGKIQHAYNNTWITLQLVYDNWQTAKKWRQTWHRTLLAIHFSPCTFRHTTSVVSLPPNTFSELEFGGYTVYSKYNYVCFSSLAPMVPELARRALIIQTCENFFGATALYNPVIPTTQRLFFRLRCWVHNLWVFW